MDGSINWLIGSFPRAGQLVPLANFMLTHRAAFHKMSYGGLILPLLNAMKKAVQRCSHLIHRLYTMHHDLCHYLQH